MPDLDDWTTALAAALGLPPHMIDKTLVLDLARDVAHAVARPAAPLTAYLAGIAVGRGVDPAAVSQTISDLLQGWPAQEDR